MVMVYPRWTASIVILVFVSCPALTTLTLILFAINVSLLYLVISFVFNLVE